MVGFLIYQADSSRLHAIWKRFKLVYESNPNWLLFQVQFFSFIVEPIGIEPMTSALRTLHYPNWATAPYFIYRKLLSTEQTEEYYYLQEQHNDSN